MKEQLEQRLIELRNEYESGKKILEDIDLRLVELENRKTILSETLIRISGAIELLEELLGEDSQGAGTDSSSVVGPVEVPDVLRQSLEKAKKALEGAGLTVGEIVEQKGVLPIGVMAGEILRQDPRPGTIIPAKSAVKLVVAVKGKTLQTDKRSMCGSFSE